MESRRLHRTILVFLDRVQLSNKRVNDTRNPYVINLGRLKSLELDTFLRR